MASVSMAPSLPSPFDVSTPPSSPQKSHRRMPSTNSNTTELPKFPFAPGIFDVTAVVDENEAAENTMDSNTRRALRASALPDFKFNPGADVQEERSPSPTHPVLQEMALNKSRVSRSARPAPLPAFTFTPHQGLGQPSPSPTRSTFADMLPSSGSGMGHRRRGSEFVGGGTAATPLLSASPEKPDYRPPPITSHPRGHTHRRSQAISISEIDSSELIKVSAISKARAGSTPNTPSENQQQYPTPRQSPPGRSSVSFASRSPPSSPRRRDSAPGFRPRVGFVDKVDVIPRPLSLISSETEGSTSTIRGGHSVSGSMNSIASSLPAITIANTSPVRFEVDRSLQRPKTADPLTLLDVGSPDSHQALSMISLPKRPMSASGSPVLPLSGSPPTKKKHFWFSSNHSTQIPPPQLGLEDRPVTSAAFHLPKADDPPRPKTSPQRSVSVKKRKYHTWTSGIFSRKTGKRSSKSKAKRNPTPPVLQRRASEKINEIFDQDDTVILREPSSVPEQKLSSTNTASVFKHAYSYPIHEDEAATPVLDLDAALGFAEETQDLSTPSRNAAARMARLHSSERRGNTDAFGSFHKRAESAPMLQPVNRGAFGMQRMGSNASLSADVFDEEEEDNFLAGETDSKTGKISPATSKTDPSKEVEALPPDLKFSGNHVQPVGGLGLSSMQSVDTDAVVIVDPEDDPISTEHRSSKSTIEAPTLPDEVMKRPVSSPMIFSYSAPHSHYASSTEGRTPSASMISSPDPEHVSFENFARHSPRLAEPSPEFVLQASNEDLPSLSDSISSVAVPRMSSSVNTRSSVDQRSASMCAPALSKQSHPAWKRASLASLNRLLPGSANGSKLKFESMPEAETDIKTKRKSNRLSKLMNFWRSKERGDG